MTALRTAAFAVAVAGGLVAAADAQAYDRWGSGHGYGYGYGHAQPYVQHHAPSYVHPRIARKQAQLQRRLAEKYGIVQPWGHQPHYRQPHWGYGHPQRQVFEYRFGW